MIILGKQETDVNLLQKLRALFRGNGDVHAQSLQHIRCAGFRGCRPVAVLGYGDATCRDDHGSRGGDIEGIGAVAAGSHDFQHIHVVKQLHAVGPHAGRRSRNFIDGLTLQRQSCQIRGHLHRRRLAAHDLIHDCFCLFISQVLFLCQF